ncbi:hypothetical protein V0M98_39015 (plasmid) [Pseudomonas silesiensis]|uniref:hypothetical protein n=1 Tax=Pseudomonas silesiensis TaxID=1853130 RepID=UPI0030D396CA
MNQQPEEFLYVVDLKNCFDVGVSAGQQEFSWDEFKELLLTHRFRNKKDGEGFMPVMMKHESEWQLVYPQQKPGKVQPPPHYRGDINIEAITALVIDLDKPGALAQAEELFAGYEYCVHSTHTYSKPQPYKFRMILRLHEPILVEDWPSCFESLKTRIDLDVSCCNPSRFYYYPSHNKENSDIKPKSYHRPGSAISMDDILAMAVEQEAVVKAGRAVKFKLPSAHKHVPLVHFTGAPVSRFDAVPDQADMSWAAQYERNKESIDHYRLQGSNHNLALTITARELGKMGPKTDIKSMLLFIFQVANHEGNKPIETGNTMNEIPGFIVTGMWKYARELYEKLEHEHTDVVAWLSSLVNWAYLSYKTERLPEPKPVQDPIAMTTTEDTRTAYAVLKDRHRSFLREFIATGDAKLLLKQVLQHELKSASPKYDDLASALTNYLIGYQTEVLKVPALQGWTSLQLETGNLGRMFSDKMVDADQKKLTFAKSAFLIHLMQRMPDEVKKASLPASPALA